MSLLSMSLCAPKDSTKANIPILFDFHKAVSHKHFDELDGRYTKSYFDKFIDEPLI